MSHWRKKYKYQKYDGLLFAAFLISCAAVWYMAYELAVPVENAKTGFEEHKFKYNLVMCNSSIYWPQLIGTFVNPSLSQCETTSNAPYCFSNGKEFKARDNGMCYSEDAK